MNKLIKTLTLTGVIATTANLWGQDPEDANQPQNVNQTKRGEIDGFNMRVVGKYFEAIDDYMNVAMVNKKYKDMTSRYKYNPIPLTDDRTRGAFSNIETQHIYDKNDRRFDDGKIKAYAYCYPVSYGTYETVKNANPNDIYKSVIFTQEDRRNKIKDDATDATILENVTEIGNYCFAGCSNLTSITIPTSVSKIGDYCFEDCSSLRSISIPTSVSEIGDHCFYSCSNLTSISIPTSVSKIGPVCFAFCSSLRSISIPASVSELGVFCFVDCYNLTSITIPTSVSVANNFRRLRLTSIIKEGALRLSDNAQVHFQEENEPVQEDIAHQENQIEPTDSFEDKSDTFSYSENL